MVVWLEELEEDDWQLLLSSCAVNLCFSSYVQLIIALKSF